MKVTFSILHAGYMILPAFPAGGRDGWAFKVERRLSLVSSDTPNFTMPKHVSDFAVIARLLGQPLEGS